MRLLLSNLIICSLALNALSVMAQDETISQATQRIAEKIYARYEPTDGNPIKEMLVESGLSIEDSDRIAREFLGGWEKVDERAEGCTLEEMQKAGITFEMMIRH